MSHKFRVKELSDARLRSDGEEIVLEFQTANREKLTLVVPGYASRQVAYQMMQFDRQAQIKRQVSDKEAEAFTVSYEAPPFLFWTAPDGLQCVVHRDTGYLDLQVQDIQNHEVQVCLNSDHVRSLFGALREVLGDLADDEPPPS